MSTCIFSEWHLFTALDRTGSCGLPACGRFSQGRPFDKAMACLRAAEPTGELFAWGMGRVALEFMNRFINRLGKCTFQREWRLSIDRDDNCRRLAACRLLISAALAVGLIA